MLKRHPFIAAITLLLGTLVSNTLLAQGTIFSGAGPVNRSMGGAAVAAPIDSIGAIYWNPASISGMPKSETAFGLGLLIPHHTVDSSVPGLAGSTEADIGAFPIPNIGWVHHTSQRMLTFGLGINTLGGFGTNLPADPTNPALSNALGGLGVVSSNALFLQMAPVISLALQDNFSVAAGPTITAARITIEPMVFDSANADGSYSTAHATRYHWGGGFQFGAYYIHDERWRFGASFKSPTWMETFEANGEDELGNPRVLTADVDLPMIISLGTSYSQGDDLLYALDVRWFDFKNTDGFGDPAVFDATGALGGLDQSSVLSVAMGVQRKINRHVTVRGGYSYNQNPTKDSESFYNIATPLIYQHILSTGLSVSFSEKLALNVAYSYYFENTVTGPIVLPTGPVGGSSISNTIDSNLISFGLTVRQ